MSVSSNGYVFYDGPSMLDGAPIVAIATGFKRKSENTKTGPMIQTWILRKDENPYSATKSLADGSVCGTCPRRPNMRQGYRSMLKRCYVKTARAPLAIWKQYQDGKYPTMDQLVIELYDWSLFKVRLGSYGDPAAVPFGVWQEVFGFNGVIGYTHQWRNCDPRFASIVMASCDFTWEIEKAEALGYRVFLPLNKYAEEPDKKKFFHCPASKEMGNRSTCAKCMQCGGTSAESKKHVFIKEH